MSDMHTYRTRINEIDTTLMRLLEERFAISEAVGQFKKTHDLPVFDAAREALILAKADSHGPAVRAVYEALLAQSRALQETKP